MTLTSDLLRHKVILFDSAPIIYFVEQHPTYSPLMRTVVALLTRNQIQAVTTPVTLTECLVYPFRSNNAKLQQAFQDIILSGKNTSFLPTNDAIAKRAAMIRATYNLTVTDATQVATAIEANCGAVLTNDKTFARVTEIPILLLDGYLTP